MMNNLPVGEHCIAEMACVWSAVDLDVDKWKTWRAVLL